MGDVMRSAWVTTLLATTVAGCFYVDPINERPSADIENVNPELPTRGQTVNVVAQIYDPDGDATFVTWSAYACAGPAASDCETEPFDTATTYSFSVTTPVRLSDDATPAARMRVELDVEDEWGARTPILQTLDVPLANATPQITRLERQGYQYGGNTPVGVPATLVATFSDADDPPASLTLSAQLFAPDSATLEDATLTDLPDGPNGERRWQLVADAPGQWDVLVTITDPFAPPASSTAMISVPVASDQPPCLRAAEPVFPPDGARIVLDARRRFAVLSVDDDFDVWPPPPAGHAVLDAASFRWWLASPATGGALAPVGAAGAEVELDPAAYAPGDELVLRVEAVDRADRALCDGAMPACELAPGCFQRRSWTVEVR